MIASGDFTGLSRQVVCEELEERRRKSMVGLVVGGNFARSFCFEWFVKSWEGGKGAGKEGSSGKWV